MSKNILYVWKSEYPWDVRVEKICKTLVENGYNVVLLARWGNGQSETEVIDGIKVIRIGYKKSTIYSLPLSGNPFWDTFIDQIVRTAKIDLIISREIMLSSTCNKIAKRYNIKHIIDMAENYPAAMKLWKKYNKNIILKFLIKGLKLADKIEKKAIEQADGIITVCKEQIERLRDLKFKNNIEVVHNTPYTAFGNNKIDLSNRNNTLKFVHHGFLTAEKRIDNFVKAFLIALEINPNMELNILGDGDCLDDLKKIVINFKNGIFKNKIIFHGSYPPLKLKELLLQNHIGILPYEQNDFNNFTIHNKVFDYFALGMPVFISDTIPFVRLINETNAGSTNDIQDIKKLSQNILNFAQSDLNKYSNNAIKYSKEKYNWNIDSKHLLKLVKDIINA